jgi:hypothetical protein
MYKPSEWNLLAIAFESPLLEPLEREEIVRRIPFEILASWARDGNLYDACGRCHALCALALIGSEESIGIIQELARDNDLRILPDVALACTWNPNKLYSLAQSLPSTSDRPLQIAIALGNILKGIQPVDSSEMHDALGFMTNPNIRRHAELVLVSILGEEGGAEFLIRHCNIKT